MSLPAVLAAAVILVVVAFNNNLVGHARDMLVSPFKAWVENPDSLKSPITLDSPEFKDRAREGVGPKRIGESGPDRAPAGSGGTGKAGRDDGDRAGDAGGGKPYGARAVGVQRAKGL